MTEPFCSPMRNFDSLQGMLRMDSLNPGIMFIGSDGYIGFESNPYDNGGMGFEIKYQCPVEEPCEDIKSVKYCKKQEKKGKCNKASVWKKCQSTCEKCDLNLMGNLPQNNSSIKTKATATSTNLRSKEVAPGMIMGECGGEVSGPSGILQSPNWPEMYPANTSCHWTIDCEDEEKPNLLVNWGDLVNNVTWDENAEFR